jgi:hypothetical protein
MRLVNIFSPFRFLTLFASMGPRSHWDVRDLGDCIEDGDGILYYKGPCPLYYYYGQTTFKTTQIIMQVLVDGTREITSTRYCTSTNRK